MRPHLLLAAVAASVAAMGGDALARPRHHGYHYGYSVAPARAPLVIERRSFLDPGTAVPVGYEHRYMVQQTFLLPPDPIYDVHRSWGGAEVLPRRFDVIPYDSGLPIDIDLF